MKKVLSVGFMVLGMAGTALAKEETCYKLSESRTPELLCISESRVEGVFDLELRMGLKKTNVATFHFNLLERARGIGINFDKYGIALPENSIFNELRIQFRGETVDGVESGIVWIGRTAFYYTKVPKE
jgi:hypothetical protein